MEGLLILGLIVVGFVVLDLLVTHLGVDTRPGSVDPRQPAGGIDII